MASCQEIISALSHPEPAKASEFFQTDSEVIPTWYEQLVYAARAYVTAGTTPELAVAPRPFVDYRKELVKEMCQTIGLDPSRWPALREEE
jgi:hypothetical protein